ncbi:MAG: lipid A deacylase LpxR family protein [Planctomycetota bacterium]
MNYHTLIACLVSFLLPGISLLAQPAGQDDTPAASRTGTVKVYWENDGAFHDPFDSYDRHYTNGFAIVLEHQPQWAEDLAEMMPLAEQFERRHGQAKTGAGYQLTQLIFTPANLSATAPIPTDQPYGGIIYGGVFWQREAQYDGRDDLAVLDHFEFNVGVVGEDSLAEDIQDWVHDNFTGVDPLGWDNQVGNEVSAQFHFRRKWRKDLNPIQSALLGDLEMQLIPQAGFALGTVYRHAEAAVTFRIGQRLPDDFGPGRINDLQSVTGDPTSLNGWSWYAFGRVGGRAVQHDLFLDGSDFETSPVSVDSEPLVGEVQAGLGVSYRSDSRNRFDLTWGVTFLSDTFDAPGATGTESYGTFVLSWTKSF